MSDITRDDLWKKLPNSEPGRLYFDPVTDEEFDQLAREAGYIKRSEAFDVWASTPIKGVRIELEADDE